MRLFNKILVTGGAGFIGSNFIRYILNSTDFKGRVINVDALTYAGNLLSLADVEKAYPSRYAFERIDIVDKNALDGCLNRHGPDCVVHFAAQSHVDRSIDRAEAFVKTNVIGTFNLLEALKSLWQKDKGVLFHHISTDEVYGSLGSEGFFKETTPYSPNSPYSASKAAADHLVRAYRHTYDFPATLSNCSNNYGPYQFPEKLIPLMIQHMTQKKPLPIYGNGNNVRDWLYVEDHCVAIWSIISQAPLGESYNVGGNNEWSNIKLVEYLCRVVAEKKGVAPESYLNLIDFVKDRLGHDKRYAINSDKIKQQLGWRPHYTFKKGLGITVDWYLANAAWVKAGKGKTSSV